MYWKDKNNNVYQFSATLMTALCTTPNCEYTVVFEYAREPKKSKVEDDFQRYINAERQKEKGPEKVRKRSSGHVHAH